MILGEILIISLVVLPLLGMGLSLLCRQAARLLRIAAAIASAEVVVAALLLVRVYQEGRIFALWKELFLDMLSAYHIILVAVVFLLASLYGVRYFDDDIRDGRMSLRRMRRYALLWNGFMASLVMVFLSDNLGALWVSLEATTLVSAFLIMTERNRLAIEAMWKYLLICSVGIAFAFVGIILLAAASRAVGGSSGPVLSWCYLAGVAGSLKGNIMLAAFIFILVGFGTKAGLAPMHTWLPDAHSQAPSPVSAAFSGVMLNGAFYGIMRFLPLTEGALGHDGQARQLVLIFGLFSIIVAAAFIPPQIDIKRFLAYSTVEHIGIVAVGIGLGGAGTFAALYHILNHSFSKCLAFFSAGRLIQHYESREMQQIKGTLSLCPLWGGGLLLALLSLIGVAPFAIFMSELRILQAALARPTLWVLALFLAGCAVVFVSALTHAMKMSLGEAPAGLGQQRAWRLETAIVVFLVGSLLLLGLWMPGPYQSILQQASQIIEGV